MTDVKIRLVILLLLIGSLLLVPRVFAQSEDALNDQTTQRCGLTQSYLKNSQKSRDLRARVDRLQAYRYISSHLETFISRLERNGQPQATELRGTLTSINDNIETFKTTYEAYDIARNQVVSVKDCRNNIEQFQTKLDDARLKRQEVNASVLSIQNLLEPTTKDQLTTLYTELLATSKTTETKL